MISVSNISILFSGKVLFENLNFLINSSDKIGLVGVNGAGKSTILKIIAKKIEANKGEIIASEDTTFGYLPQEMHINSTLSIYDETLTAFSELEEIEKTIEKLNHEIEIREDFESKAYLQLVDDLTHQNERFSLFGGETAKANVEKVLKGLGFKQSDLIRPLPEFSNGWQMRVELAKILLRQPSCLLLDEPTNHLDIDSIQWLEEYLQNYHGSVLLVSHDRAFLDNITIRTIEITHGKIYDYKANYSHYVQLREDRLKQQKATYNNQQKEIQQIERFVERFRYKSTKSKQVQSRIKQLNKINIVELDNIDRSAIHFKFPPAPSSGKVVVETKALNKSYGDLHVLKDLDFISLKGEKIAFVGKNGEGKTTLAKIIAGALEYEGQLNLGHNVSIGYYAQNQWEMLSPEKTVFETIDDVAVGDIRKNVKSILGSFMFGGEAIDKKVKVLSGGEKSRLSLAKLLLEPVNLLILDEPTNHLDMRSKDILKNALLMYEGSLIIVSHDRDFLQGLTSKVIEFNNKSIKEYLGDIYDFLEKKKIESLKSLEKIKTNGGHQKKDKISENKLRYEQKKQFERDLRKLSNQISKCEENIEKFETEISLMDNKLSKPEENTKEITSGELYKSYEILKKKLEVEMLKWENLQIEFENKQQ
jgi:ATP-binding cassette subfamily F protein 3